VFVPGAPLLAVHAVDERVDHDVAGGGPDPGEQALDALSGLAHEDPPGDGLVLGRVLPEHQHPGAAVEPAAVEDRPPFCPEVGRRIHLLGRVVGDQGVERAHGISRAGTVRHGLPFHFAAVTVMISVAKGNAKPAERVSAPRSQPASGVS
jgi:hypothetical protein